MSICYCFIYQIFLEYSQGEGSQFIVSYTPPIYTLISFPNCLSSKSFEPIVNKTPKSNKFHHDQLSEPLIKPRCFSQIGGIEVTSLQFQKAVLKIKRTPEAIKLSFGFF